MVHFQNELTIISIMTIIESKFSGASNPKSQTSGHFGKMIYQRDELDDNISWSEIKISNGDQLMTFDDFSWSIINDHEMMIYILTGYAFMTTVKDVYSVELYT